MKGEDDTVCVCVILYGLEKLEKSPSPAIGGYSER